jgi:hypothetical protein
MGLSSEEEKALIREMLPRIEEGYRMAERLRRQDIKETDTATGLRAFDGLVRESIARYNPDRVSGIVEMYRVLAKTVK